MKRRERGKKVYRGLEAKTNSTRRKKDGGPPTCVMNEPPKGDREFTSKGRRPANGGNKELFSSLSRKLK